LGQRTILVADDDRAVLELVEMILSNAGCKVLTAADGLEAVKVFEKHADEVAAVILDMTMPNLSGEETLKRLRVICKDVPIILSSGFTDSIDSDKFRELGVAGFVRKPYPIGSLLETVQKALKPE